MDINDALDLGSKATCLKLSKISIYVIPENAKK